MDLQIKIVAKQDYGGKAIWLFLSWEQEVKRAQNV